MIASRLVGMTTLSEGLKPDAKSPSPKPEARSPKPDFFYPFSASSRTFFPKMVP